MQPQDPHAAAGAPAPADGGRTPGGEATPAPQGDPNGQPPLPAPKPSPLADKKPALENGAVIKGKWKILAKIGQGAFGETYVGECTSGNVATVAIKVEQPTGTARRDVLKTEVIALKKLQACPSVVRYLSSGKDEVLGISFLVMQRLGYDLAELKRRTRKARFDLATTIRLGVQMLECIRGVHELHYIHRDIKPSNFVVGREDSGNIYLIDFGLARRYRSNEGEIRPARQPAGFRGTARYASIHSHKQMELGRRDDLWCLFYVLVEFRLEGGLPWRRHKDKNTIGEMKERFTNEKLVEKLPTEFYLFMKHLFSLRYESEPNYYYLKQLLESIAENECVSLDAPMEWQRDDAATTPNADPAPPPVAHPPAAGGQNGIADAAAAAAIPAAAAVAADKRDTAPPAPPAADHPSPATPKSNSKPRGDGGGGGDGGDAASSNGVVELQIVDDFGGKVDGAVDDDPLLLSPSLNPQHLHNHATPNLTTPGSGSAVPSQHRASAGAPVPPPQGVRRSIESNPIDAIPRPTGFATQDAARGSTESADHAAKEQRVQHAKVAQPTGTAGGTLVYTEAKAAEEKTQGEQAEANRTDTAAGGGEAPKTQQQQQQQHNPTKPPDEACKCCMVM